MKNEESLAYFLNESKIIKIDELEKKLRVAILGSFTVNGVEETLRVKCSQNNIDCRTYVGNYNQYNQEILKKNSELYKFNAELTFLVLDVRHVLGELFFYPYSLNNSEKEEFSKNKVQEIINLLKTIRKNSKSQVILTELQIPIYSPYGINEQKEEFGIKQLVTEINKKIRY